MRKCLGMISHGDNDLFVNSSIIIQALSSVGHLHLSRTKFIYPLVVIYFTCFVVCLQVPYLFICPFCTQSEISPWHYQFLMFSLSPLHMFKHSLYFHSIWSAIPFKFLSMSMMSCISIGWDITTFIDLVLKFPPLFGSLNCLCDTSSLVLSFYINGRKPLLMLSLSCSFLFGNIPFFF